MGGSGIALSSVATTADAMAKLKDIGSCFFRVSNQDPSPSLSDQAFYPHASGIFSSTSDTHTAIIARYEDALLRVISTNTKGISSPKINTIYGTANTTKASDGTLKAASPVARIASPDISSRPDIDEDNFEWCGYGVANSEAAGIEIIRENIGVYRVTGAISLATSGWRLLPPRDPNGSGDLAVVTAEEREDDIIITLCRRKMVLEEGEIVIKAGEPIDVPANSWIDVRLEMPAQPPQIEPEQ